MTSLNIVFAGTPAFALPCLEALAISHHKLQAIYTQPDRPAGRGRKLQASPVKTWAETHQLPVLQPLNFKAKETVDELAAMKPDIMIVIAYGLILPRNVLEIPRLGCINVHASLLPRWRGASPIQQAILHDDFETGVTIMQMDVGMDTGAILSEVSCPIQNDTAYELHDRLAKLATLPLLETLDKLAAGKIQGKMQNNTLATYAPKINKEDAVIHWDKPAKEIDCQIRAFNPWPIAYTQLGDINLRIHQARFIKEPSRKTPGTILSIDKSGVLVATSDYAILIERFQFPGSKNMSVAEWLHAGSSKLRVGMIFEGAQ